MKIGLSCYLCGKQYDRSVLQTLCTDCKRPLRVDYDLDPSTMSKEALKDREPSMWRYREVLPPCEVVSLGEGMTPLWHTPSLGLNVWVKDEGVNPTASFKARGISVAVSMAKHLGATELAAPSAGNAGGALAAYCAKAGLKAHVYMPKDTPLACIIEAQMHGADVQLIDGLINDCGRMIAEVKEERGWFDVSTLKEPYRIEGKKTMGYEIAEQMSWSLPDAIIYPTGGGTGLIGMWKAFDEMERMEWIGSKRPKMISVQATGCCPIVTAFEKGERFAELHENAHTVASGLRVPAAVGDFIMLDLIRASGGTAIAVTDEEMISCAREIAAKTGVFACPEGGATLAAYRRLIDNGFLKESDQTVLFNTGSGVKYLEALGQ
ncbi:MAG: threonine synthase [Armatimonadetes bacterium]|nr:threonine synthase [Armatimonadota bacterium]